MTNPKRDFYTHLTQLGFDFQSPRQVILQKLHQRMGDQRFGEFKARHSHSASSQQEFYKQFKDIIEGNLMRSLDTTATLDASFSLYERSVHRLLPGSRVIELGCWTGGLASFIAMKHPQCAAVGVDFARHVIEACKAHYRVPNLSFCRWDYRWGKPEELEPADVLLCAMGVVHHMPDNSELSDIEAIRRSPEYRKQRDHALGYFSVWRSAAKEGASFFAVLRIGLLARFLAWLDAAQQTGWTPRIDRLWHVEMTDEKPLPGLLFEARVSEPFSEDAVVESWVWFQRRNPVFAKLEDAAALATFRTLQSKTPLAKRSYRMQGMMVHDEVGVCGGSGYVLTHSALYQFRLLLMGRSRAEALAAAVSKKGELSPVTDEGVLARTQSKGSIGSDPIAEGARDPANLVTSASFCADGSPVISSNGPTRGASKSIFAG